MPSRGETIQTITLATGVQVAKRGRDKTMTNTLKNITDKSTCEWWKVKHDIGKGIQFDYEYLSLCHDLAQQQLSFYRLELDTAKMKFAESGERMDNNQYLELLRKTYWIKKLIPYIQSQMAKAKKIEKENNILISSQQKKEKDILRTGNIEIKKSVNECFVEACKEELPRDQFMKLVDKAKEMHLERNQ